MSFPDRDPNRRSSLREWFRRRIPYFWSNWVSAVGSMIAITAVFLLLVMLLVFLYHVVLDRPTNPYVDLVGFLVLPALLVFGLVLLGIGNLVRRSRRDLPSEKRSGLEVGRPIVLRKALTVALATLVLLFGFGAFSYEAYHFTDSNRFCMNVCHKVMQPEGTAYQYSPHARVRCVDCHIGSGASWYVRSKLSGVRQVWAVLTHTYDTPIPTPVENLRPARETCEQCHWPARFQGADFRISLLFRPDSSNTRAVTANLVEIGGPPYPTARARGIHWHVDPGNEILYRALDRQRQDIVEVVQKTPQGEVHYYAPGGETDTTAGTWRLMDCMDCHNRPTHIFQMPDQVVNQALAEGRLDTSLAWIKQAAVAVLQEVEPGDSTRARLGEALLRFYAKEHPEQLEAAREDAPQAAAVLAGYLERNVFPAMKVTWGTYRSNIGHFQPDGEMGGGCFRCHDEEHTSPDGATIGQDCDKCHVLLAWDETDWKGLGGLGPSAWLAR